MQEHLQETLTSCEKGQGQSSNHSINVTVLESVVRAWPDDIRKGFEKSSLTDACRSDFTVDYNQFAGLFPI